MEILNFNEWQESNITESYNRAVTPKGDWVELDGEDLPQGALDFMKNKTKGKNQAWNWIEAYYRGDMETTSDWVIVTDDGENYREGAEFMIWGGKKDKPVTGDEEYVKVLKNLLK